MLSIPGLLPSIGRAELSWRRFMNVAILIVSQLLWPRGWVISSLEVTSILPISMHLVKHQLLEVHYQEDPGSMTLVAAEHDTGRWRLTQHRTWTLSALKITGTTHLTSLGLASDSLLTLYFLLWKGWKRRELFFRAWKISGSLLENTSGNSSCNPINLPWELKNLSFWAMLVRLQSSGGFISQAPELAHPTQ